MIAGVYRITNSADGRFYIGSAVDLRNRWRKHVNCLRANEHHNHNLQRAWIEYGEACFSFKPMLYCSKEHLLLYEQKVMDAYMATKLGYNILPSAGSPIGRVLTEETKRRISLALLGRPRPEEVRRKVSEGNTGVKRSDEFKRHLSIMWSGTTQSAEHIKKRADAYRARGHRPSALTIQKAAEMNLGRRQSPEVIEKRAAALRGRKRGSMSMEHKIKLSLSLKGRKRAPESIAQMLATRRARAHMR